MAEIMLAGFGGQGVLFAGKVIAAAGMESLKNVSWLPSYGPEMRGGTCNCKVIVSDEQIASPDIAEPDFLLAMNAPSLDKFEGKVRAGGTIIMDSSLIGKRTFRKDVNIVCIPAKKIAEKMGDGRLGNMVMTGCFINRYGKISLSEVVECMRRSVSKAKASLAELNIKMLKAGYAF